MPTMVIRFFEGASAAGSLERALPPARPLARPADLRLDATMPAHPLTTTQCAPRVSAESRPPGSLRHAVLKEMTLDRCRVTTRAVVSDGAIGESGAGEIEGVAQHQQSVGEGLEHRVPV